MHPSKIFNLRRCRGHISNLLTAGDVSGCEEGDSTAVQDEGQVLPRGRGRGADPGRHQEDGFPAGEGEHPVGGRLLPPGDRRASGLLRRPGQIRRVRQVEAPIGLPFIRAPAAKEVSCEVTLDGSRLKGVNTVMEGKKGRKCAISTNVA